MYDKFGEFDSHEELNRAAAAQLKEGDDEALMALALENGIDEEDVKDYINGDIQELATPLTAAFGKLDVEAEDLEPYGIMEDWITYIRIRCSEEPAMALAVRRKGKSLKSCMASLLTWSLQNAREVDKDILKKAAISYRATRVTLGIPGMAQAKRIITQYYLGGES